jgi:hypothetical protein
MIKNNIDYYSSYILKLQCLSVHPGPETHIPKKRAGQGGAAVTDRAGAGQQLQTGQGRAGRQGQARPGQAKRPGKF